MSGYSNFSKSNNAVAAESAGRFPASVLGARLGVASGAIRSLMKTGEWHHSSKYFNIVEYYSEEAALEIIDELKAWRDPAAAAVAQTWVNCSGEYLVWGGTRSHPHATKIQFEGARATRAGDWFTLEIAGQSKFRKGKATRGFVIRNADGKTLN